ncbi:MAG: hypothetical protein ACHQAU_03095, partial [Gammaproteobacteria bacterium]
MNKVKILIALVVITGLAGFSRYSAAAPDTLPVQPDKVDQAVIASLPVWKGDQAQLLAHIDLTTPFATTSQWAFVVAQDPTPPPEALPDGEEGHGPLAICFVKDLVPQCTEGQNGEDNLPWSTSVYRLMDDKI